MWTKGLWHWYRGEAFIGLERFEEALVDLRQACNLDYCAPPYQEAARAFLKLGRAREAQAAAVRAVMIEPENAFSCSLVGAAAFEAGDYGLSVSWSTEALKLASGEPYLKLAARLNLAVALLASGDSDATMTHLQEALNTDHLTVAPDESAGLFAEARADIKKLLKARPDLKETAQGVLVLLTGSADK